MRVAYYTLGCKVNQFETGALERLLADKGHTRTAWEEPADAYVINTCTVTATSDAKSRKAIRAIRRARPGAVVAVRGCLGQASPDALLALGADLVAGTGDMLSFAALLEDAVKVGGARKATVTDAGNFDTFERLSAGSPGGRTRALLKIQDGCDNCCAYCVIPHVRGPSRSLPPEEAVAEAVRLAALGYREIVLTGIEISSYGRDLCAGDRDLCAGGRDLCAGDNDQRTGDNDQCIGDRDLCAGGRDLCAGADLGTLIGRICRTAPDVRVRLGSLAPHAVTKSFVEKIRELPNLCPHFHVSLQSGCDQTLARMNRGYGTARYAAALHALREAFPDGAMTTDLIVGFPGEDEAEFAKTLLFLEQCAFAWVHVFPYSKRADTPASAFHGQVSPYEKKIRAARASALVSQMAHTYARKYIGRTVRVLFEKSQSGGADGHADNYLMVHCPHEDGEALQGRILPVHIEGILGARKLFGHLCETC